MPLHPQTAAAMGNLLHKLAGHPKTRAATLGLIKQVEPGYRLPADVAIADSEARMRAEFQKGKDTERDERAARTRANQRKKLVDSHGEDVVKEIEEKIVKKYPTIDLEDAAKLYASEDGPARPSSSRPESRPGSLWEFPDIPGLLQNPDKAAQNAAYTVIDELRGRG
ncbi:MAG TPA: hypothetical protein VN325_23335 [Steroidobacteraceae bacterium]|nr:hypothetical protein [Steroidobacteraceae bacterium]